MRELTRTGLNMGAGLSTGATASRTPQFTTPAPHSALSSRSKHTLHSLPSAFSLLRSLAPHSPVFVHAQPFSTAAAPEFTSSPPSHQNIIPVSPHAQHLNFDIKPSTGSAKTQHPVTAHARSSPQHKTPLPSDSLAFSHPSHDDPAHPIFDPSLPGVDYLGVRGYVHSTESMGSLEGPGNRFLVFLTGCMCRCLYCENPDTWDVQKGGTSTSVARLVDKASRMKPYYVRSVGGGGVTVSGGDPLVQHDFLAAFLYACKRDLGLNTCVETTGLGTRRALETVLPWTDLVLLCIKGTNSTSYSHITQTPSRSFSRMLHFITELRSRNIPWWCRYVVVPGLTDSDKDVDELVELINGEESGGCERVELLPYHTLGEHKWKELGLEYPLPSTPYPTKARLEAIATRIRNGLVNKNISVSDGAE
ncbi:pyruvate formate-lyase activating [Gonapodya prolifera JEL478]|uniref:Pyruvate formate-lyase activating n=1 Tax=Gonapodya prolifera (strain JEL478) TaxID=1344416 RepID=A0A139A8L2_GONPJ|nr:pyruvate formate-lyase activating [Gonapodya prolifera JEL478]|eukprot:KXS13120.1 pyruvate formate-lyase activating [Gonapodya prolifera JEL478]